MTTNNPKEKLGQTKYDMSTVPTTVLAEVAVAMMEGARKYGKHNYRDTDISMSIYYAAVWRHIMSWFEGEDIDPESGVHHVTKAITSLMVLRDGMINGKVVDDRPINSGELADHFKKCNEMAKELLKKYPQAEKEFTRVNANI